MLPPLLHFCFLFLFLFFVFFGGGGGGVGAYSRLGSYSRWALNNFPYLQGGRLSEVGRLIE